MFSDNEAAKSYSDLVSCNIVYHWLSEDEQLNITTKVFSILKHSGLFLSFPTEQVQNVKVMLPYCSKELQQRIHSVIPYQPDQYYPDLFTSSGFKIVSFWVEVIETKFQSVHSYLEWADASFETKEDLKKVCHKNENKIQFPCDVDRTICDIFCLDYMIGLYFVYST